MQRRFLHVCRQGHRRALGEGSALDVDVEANQLCAHGRMQALLSRSLSDKHRHGENPHLGGGYGRYIASPSFHLEQLDKRFRSQQRALQLEQFLASEGIDLCVLRERVDDVFVRERSRGGSDPEGDKASSRSRCLPRAALS